MKKSDLKALIKEVIQEFRVDKDMTNPYVPVWVEQVFKAFRALFSLKMMGGKLDLKYDEANRKITCGNIKVVGIHTITLTAESEIEPDNFYPWDRVTFSLEIMTDSDYYTKSRLKIKEAFATIKQYIAHGT